jgi:hypothetical protein
VLPSQEQGFFSVTAGVAGKARCRELLDKLGLQQRLVFND